jgi:hypothetical protein
VDEDALSLHRRLRVPHHRVDLTVPPWRSAGDDARLERTSISTYRSAASVLGTILAAVATLPGVAFFGGGAQGYLVMGCLYGVWLSIPWAVVFLRTAERPDFQREPSHSFLEGVRLAAGHRAYRQLMALYLCSRVAMDVVGAMLIYYFTFWLARPGDFEATMGLMLVAAVVSLPFCPCGCRDGQAHASSQALLVGRAALLPARHPAWPADGAGPGLAGPATRSRT